MVWYGLITNGLIGKWQKQARTMNIVERFAAAAALSQYRIIVPIIHFDKKTWGNRVQVEVLL